MLLVNYHQAAAGFVPYGNPEINGYPKDHDNFLYDTFVLGGDDMDTLQLSGTFKHYLGGALPASIALYLYVDSEDAPNDFIRGRGEIDPSTGDWTATVSDIPLKMSEVVLSFVVTDPADAAPDSYGGSVYTLDVLNTGCGNSLTITLESDPPGAGFNIADLYVTEPTGTVVWFRNECGVS